MGWKIEHKYDPTLDVVEGRFTDVHIATVADVARWKKESEAQYRAIARRADLLVNLDGLEVAAAVRHEWSVARRYIAETYLVGTYRYNGKTSTRTAIYTGAVLDNAGGEVFASREEAMAALMSRRNATRRARPR
jgi:hypothetical protein